MPVKQRAAKERRPSFSAEAIALFAELERSPDGWRPYTDESYRLAVMLNLVTEWWSSYHVNDASTHPTHSPGFVAYDAFFTTREVRAALLTICAAGELEAVRDPEAEGTAEPPAA